jgi:tetratricopeptide (TPR) repeat protein
MITDSTVADEQARAAARLRGSTEALNVLQRRLPADQQRACQFAVDLLSRYVATADWIAAGLPEPGGARECAEYRCAVGHPAVLRLARAAMALHCAELRVDDRPAHWDRLAEFFARQVSASDPELVRLRERAAIAHVDANNTAPAVFKDLLGALDFHRARDGEDGYLTTLARANLSVAYRQRRSGDDLARATLLAEEEVRTRTTRYGPDHPVTLVARSLLTLSLLLQAEASASEASRHALADRALAEITEVRVARDRLFGVTSPNATNSRRYEARALLLLGQHERARSCLEYTLTFENTRNAGRQTQSIGQTHYQLARVHCALGEPAKALHHARQAREIFELHNPAGRAATSARSLIQELSRATQPG